MRILKAFKQVKWWEYLYLVAFLTIILVFGLVYHSSALVIINALIGVTAVFFIAKGMVIGNILGLLSCATYSTLSFLNAYYGEMIVCIHISVPTYAFSIFTWMKNLKQGETLVKVNRKMTTQEWVISLLSIEVVGIGIYYLLKSFDTANLIVSTFSVTSSAMAGYLLARRSEYAFVFYILNNFASIYLWSSVIIAGDTSSVPTLINFIIYFILNVTGIINWLKIKKAQKPPAPPAPQTNSTT